MYCWVRYFPYTRTQSTSIVAGKMASDGGSPSKLPPTERLRITKYGCQRIELPYCCSSDRETAYWVAPSTENRALSASHSTA